MTPALTLMLWKRRKIEFETNLALPEKQWHTLQVLPGIFPYLSTITFDKMPVLT